MGRQISGTMLRDLVRCERRFGLDLTEDLSKRDEISDFVRMLWEGGAAFEREIVAGLRGTVVDLRDTPASQRATSTLAAFEERPDWIVGGRIEIGDRIGVPDLLRWTGAYWEAGDVKSGGALDDAGRPRIEYRAQVGHYASIVADLDLGPRDRAFVIGRDGGRTSYGLEVPLGQDGVSINEEVADLLGHARAVIAGRQVTRPALSSACSMCHWRTVCRAELEEADDLTLIAGLGRALRTVMEPVAPTVTELAALEPAALGISSHTLPGLGMSRLIRFRDRARLLRTPGAQPFARRPLGLRRYPREFHFDIETHPLLDGLVYLHGVLDVRAGEETYVSFFAEDLADEQAMFAQAWAFLTSDPEAHIFYYSKFERTSYRLLAKRYPEVCSGDEVEALFSPSRATDLLGDAVLPSTEWPTHSMGVKALAKWCGFSWSDVDPSGASSIAWFNQWLETRDPVHRERLEAYNADDVRATVVLLEALIALPVSKGPSWPFAA
jgi:predicted RecB family nuclease